LKFIKLKPIFANLLEILIGCISVATGIWLLSVIGQQAEPYLQWIPAIAELRAHPEYNMVPYTDGFVRHMYVCFILLLSTVAFTGIAGFITLAALWCRDIGRKLLGLLLTKEIT